MSDVFDRCAPTVLASLLAGSSVAEAARLSGCSPRTVERWIANGREDRIGALGLFVGLLDEWRRREIDSGPVTEAELIGLLSRLVRAGSVPAMRLYWRVRFANRPTVDPLDDPLAELDELAARRNVREGAA